MTQLASRMMSRHGWQCSNHASDLGAPGGIRTPNLLIQSQMLPESYHLLESYRGQGVSERRSASGRAEARARASLVSRVFFAFPISVQPPRDD